MHCFSIHFSLIKSTLYIIERYTRKSITRVISAKKRAMTKKRETKVIKLRKHTKKKNRGSTTKERHVNPNNNLDKSLDELVKERVDQRSSSSPLLSRRFGVVGKTIHVKYGVGVMERSTVSPWSDSSSRTRGRIVVKVGSKRVDECAPRSSERDAKPIVNDFRKGGDTSFPLKQVALPGQSIVNRF